MACEDGSRDWSDVSTAKHCWQPPEARRDRHGTHPPSEHPERTNPADTLISDFWPFITVCERMNFCYFKIVAILQQS